MEPLNLNEWPIWVQLPVLIAIFGVALGLPVGFVFWLILKDPLGPGK